VIRLAALALFATACATHTYTVARVTPAVRFQGSTFQGAELSASGEGHGVGVSISASAQSLSRPVFDGTQSRIGGGVTFGARVSLFGLFAGNHEIDHWFDLGASGAAGGGLVYPASLTTFGELSGGGWLAFGLFPGARHPALVLEIRRVVIQGWNDMTLFTVGIGVASRRFEDWDLRD
jgi:hypothetical protein